MAIEGYFRSGLDLEPAAYVRTYIYLPRLGISGSVDFLIDTGADRTALHPWDIDNLGISYRRLRRSTLTYAGGIGGELGYYRESGIVVFRESQSQTRAYELDFHISERTNAPELDDLPSLLGRNFLNYCDFRMNKPNNLVEIEPLAIP